MNAAICLALAAATTLAPGQSGKLTLTNARATYGLLGPARSDLRVLPGDILCLEFDIEGIAVPADGKVEYSMGLEVVDAKGKVIYKQNPTNLKAIASLGGRTVSAQAYVDIGLDTPPGDLTVNISVTETSSKQAESLTQKVEVLPAGLGIVQLKLTSDASGLLPAGLVGSGESIWVTFATVHFGRDNKQQPNVQFELRILDEGGKPVGVDPQTGLIDRTAQTKEKLLGAQFLVCANRAGKFVVELKATDKVAGKSATTSFPLIVYPRR